MDIVGTITGYINSAIAWVTGNLVLVGGAIVVIVGGFGIYKYVLKR